MARSPAKTFAIAAAVTVTVAAFMLPAINLVIDPFRAFGGPEIAGLTEVKPASTHRGRLSKAYSVCRIRPDLIFMGGSRAEFLYDPRHPAVAAISQHPYNLALAGTGIFETGLMLRHAYFASGRLNTAVISLDFLMFNAYREIVSLRREIIDYTADRLVLSPADSCLQAYLRESDTLLFSAAALESSYMTVTTQDFYEIYFSDGLRHPYYNMLSKTLRLPVLQRRGLISHARQYIDWVWLPPPDRRYCFRTDDGSISTFAVLRDIVSFARDKGVYLIFVLSPEHAYLQVAMREAGLWPLYERWKRNIVEILGTDAAQHGDGGFPLYDFSRLNAITTEPAPPLEPNARMMYWYEASHSNLIVGNLILDRVLGHVEPGTTMPANFGERIDAGSIEAHLAQGRIDLDRYYDGHPDSVQEVRQVAASLDYLGRQPACRDDQP